MESLLLLAVSALLPVAARADQVKVLNRGDQTLAAMYLAIKGAQKTIDVATFVLEPCNAAPKALLSEMLKKAKSGVKVRLLVEGYGSKEPMFTQLPAYLYKESEKNFEVRFHGSSSILSLDSPRSHIKAFVVDAGQGGAAQIVGGRNWTDDYFGLGGRLNYIDQDLLLTGASANEAAKYFNQLWKIGSARTPTGDGAAWGRSCFARNARDAEIERFLTGQALGVFRGRHTYSCPSVTYVTDDPYFMASMSPALEGTESGPDNDFLVGERYNRKRATGLWLDFIAGTRRKLSMVNQYFMPWSKVKQAIANLRRERKSVEVISNATGDVENNPSQNRAFTCWIQSSAYQGNQGTVHVDLLTSRGSMQDRWALSVQGPPWRIHTKTGIRDDRDVLVSSWNIDPRSYHTNLESAVYIEACPGLPAALNEQYEQLRGFVRSDRGCHGCDSEFERRNLSDTVRCGGAAHLF